MAPYPSSNPRPDADLEEPPPGWARPASVDPLPSIRGRVAEEPAIASGEPEERAAVELEVDPTHDRRVVELTELAASVLHTASTDVPEFAGFDLPRSLLDDAALEVAGWRPERLLGAMRDAESWDADPLPGGGDAPAVRVVAGVAAQLRDRRTTAMAHLVPLLRDLGGRRDVRDTVATVLGERVLGRERVSREVVERAVDRAFETAVAGPAIDGVWPVEPTIASARRLVVALALQFVLAPNERLAREMVACGRPGAATSITLPGGEIGPLARHRDGGFLTRRFRAGGVVVVGPPGGGKTSMVKVLLAAFRGTVVVTTNKLRDLVEPLRLRLDDGVEILDSAGTAGRLHGTRQVRHDPVAGLGSFRDAVGLMEVMARAREAGSVDPSDKRWVDWAIPVGAALLWWAACSDLSVVEAARAAGDTRSMDRAFRELDARSEAGRVLRVHCARVEATRSGIDTFVAGVLQAWTVARPEWDDCPAFDAAAICRRGGTLVLCSDSQGSGDDNIVAACALDDMVKARFSMAERGEAVPPMLLLLDECGTTAPHFRLPEWTATGPGRGVNSVLFFQDSTTQILRAWGTPGVGMINNAGTIVVYPGVADMALRQLVNGFAVGGVLGVNPVDVVSSSAMPAPPPPPGSVYVVDEHRHVEVADQVRFHEEPSLVWAAIEAAVVHDPRTVAAFEAAGGSADT